MNLKKYNNGKTNNTSRSVINTSIANKTMSKITNNYKSRPSTAPVFQSNKHLITKPNILQQKPVQNNTIKTDVNGPKDVTKVEIKTSTLKSDRKTINFNKIEPTKNVQNNSVIDKTAMNKVEPKKTFEKTLKKPDIKPIVTKKTLNKIPISTTNLNKTTSSLNTKQENGKRLTVFERLYNTKPKIIKHDISKDEKLQSKIVFKNKLVKNAELNTNKRHTLFQPVTKVDRYVRRSISAIHLKRMNKSELPNCFHKWSSIGNNLDKAGLSDINEDASVQMEGVTSAVKSERKKTVTFQKGIAFNLNTPTADELQMRLKKWLEKRGKSLDSYQHLQCFGNFISFLF